MAKQDRAKNNPPKPEGLDQFQQIDVPLTDIENQLIAATEARKNKLTSSIVITFAEQMQHQVAMFAAKKNIQYNDGELFAGVYYDQVKQKAYILQFKSKEDADAYRAARQPEK